MVDQYNRTIEYLRISVTDRCNLRCRYCMPREGIAVKPHEEMLRFEETIQIVEQLAQLGIHTIKITGGEPLTKRGLVSFIQQIHEIPGIREITLTTNGLLLSGQTRELVDAGVDVVNISLDTLDANQYTTLTGFDGLDRVKQAIDESLQAGFQKVKINAVILQNENEQMILPLAALAKNRPLAVRFIEMMPIGMGARYAGVKQQQIMDTLEQVYGKLEHLEMTGNGPARYFHLTDFLGEIGFISAISHTFCSECNRIRLTADGQLKTCLDAPPVLDVKKLLREGCKQEALREKLQRAIYEKPSCHHFTDQNGADREIRTMTQIGG